jgi:hypothetical protein
MSLVITQVTIDDKPLPITVGKIDHSLGETVERNDGELIRISGYDVLKVTTPKVHPEFEYSCLTKGVIRVEVLDEQGKAHGYDMHCVACELSPDGPADYEFQEIKK